MLRPLHTFPARSPGGMAPLFRKIPLGEKDGGRVLAGKAWGATAPLLPPRATL